jgi:sec-independent protein translocase protein TatA
MGIGWKELLIILVLVLLIFGTKKLKNIGKDLGGAIGGFKEGLKEGQDSARIGNDSLPPTGSGAEAEAAAKAKADAEASREGGGPG